MDTQLRMMSKYCRAKHNTVNVQYIRTICMYMQILNQTLNVTSIYSYAKVCNAECTSTLYTVQYSLYGYGAKEQYAECDGQVDVRVVATSVGEWERVGEQHMRLEEQRGERQRELAERHRSPVFLHLRVEHLRAQRATAAAREAERSRNGLARMMHSRPPTYADLQGGRLRVGDDQREHLVPNRVASELPHARPALAAIVAYAQLRIRRRVLAELRALHIRTRLSDTGKYSQC